MTGVSEKTVLAVGSVTNAMRGRELLAQNGISALLGRGKPGQLGCGYTLAVSGDETKAVRLLEAAGIRVRRVP